MFSNDTRKAIVISNISELNRAYELLAKHEQTGYKAEFYVSTADDNSYWVKGSTCYHLVSFSKVDKQGVVKCSCVSQYLCYHIGAVAKHHIAKKQQPKVIAPIEVKKIIRLPAIAHIDCECMECGKSFTSVGINDFLWCPTCDIIKTQEHALWVASHKPESALSKKYKQMKLTKKQTLALQALG